MESKKEFECPTGAFDCPYYEMGLCTISDEPWEDCDDAAFYHDWDEEEDEGE
jgi:hypothetical protein